MDVRRVINRSGAWSGQLPGELDGPSTLVLVTSALSADAVSAPLSELVRAFPRSTIVGCSTAGDIVDADVLDESFVATVVRFSATRLKIATAPVCDGAGSTVAGETIGAALASHGLRAVFVLCDGLDVNGSELTRALTAALPGGVVVTGGLAADGDRFQHTWVLVDGRPVESFVTAVGFYGDRLRVGHGSGGGWDPFGPERTVTRSEGNVLFELDGRPALSLYREYLGDLAADLPGSALLFPLAVRAHRSVPPEQSVVRTILGIDEHGLSLRFAGDVPQGWTAQLMHANFDRLVDAAEAATRHAAIDARDGEAREGICLAISCVGRRLVLGERVSEETAAVRDSLPPAVALVGFYSYGEISPGVQGSCDLHNQTMTITTLGEIH